MKLTICSLETAKQLKNIKFDLKVNLHYESSGNRFFNLIECNFNNAEFICSAPTLALVQMWLREKHDIHIEIGYRNTNNISNYYYCLQYKYGSQSKTTKWVTLTTYNKALEAGILEAIKLIKTKQNV